MPDESDSWVCHKCGSRYHYQRAGCGCPTPLCPCHFHSDGTHAACPQHQPKEPARESV